MHIWLPFPVGLYIAAALLAAYACSTPAWAQSTDETSDLPQWLQTRMEPVRYGLNDWVNNTSRSIDRFFGTDDRLSVDNDSFMRLSQRVNYARGDHDTETKLRFRLDLPTTEKRLRVVVESNVSELEPLLGRDGNSSTGDLIDNAESALGLESGRSTDENKTWDGRVGLGLRFRSGLDPYIRYTASRRFQFENSPWQAYSFNRVVYYDQRGYQARSSLDFNRPLTSQTSVRSLTQAEWEQTRGETSYIQSFELNQVLDQRNTLRYAALLLGNTAQSPSLFEKVLQVYLRRDIHNRVLFLDVILQYHFPSDDSIPSYASLTLQLEMFFRADFER